MRSAVDVRVSTQRQAHRQTSEQHLERLQTPFQEQGWEWEEDLVFRDAGSSGASLKRPGLDRVPEQAAQARRDRVVITTPDRLARTYIHHMLLIEELEKGR
jgi:site-specific DNA recombinase